MREGALSIMNYYRPIAPHSFSAFLSRLLSFLSPSITSSPPSHLSISQTVVHLPPCAAAPICSLLTWPFTSDPIPTILIETKSHYGGFLLLPACLSKCVCLSVCIPPFCVCERLCLPAHWAFFCLVMSYVCLALIGPPFVCLGGVCVLIQKQQ